MSRSRSSHGFAILADFVSLFAGRVGGILVTLFFIPQYNRLLGADAFGAIAVVLSLQAFFLMSDLGLATLISRDTAVARDNPAALAAVAWTRRRAEVILAVLALGVLAVAISLPLAGAPVPWSLTAGVNAGLIAILMVLLVGTNIVQLSLNALGLYRAGAGISVAGALARGAATVIVLRSMPSFSAFLQVQVAMATVHFVLARWVLERGCAASTDGERLLNLPEMMRLMRRCTPLVLYTLGGAAAVNLDKSIVSAFISLKIAGTYFLATTYALVPVGILSGPINSYFAPRVAHARHAGDSVREYRLALTFQLVLMCIVVGPSLSLAFQMSDWLMLWLHDAAQVNRIMIIAPILLAGGALSATGYYPTTYLIAAEDNGYLARLSIVAAIGVLIATPFFAAHHDLVGVAWSYCAFYAAGFVGLWLRLASRIGWGAMARFLAIAYLMPMLVITLAYLSLHAVAAAFAVPAPLALLGPMAVASAVGMLACAAVFLRERNRPGWAAQKEIP
ncbi:lipopolysaccharide biosynthesis protein [Sphingomonas sp. TX0543]|uniref:lipopolysaccharide biosynthesis protein n=1 Tax=Sphingomonas sp. TX0543 TaxID=3399682 RepID=UPI003AFB21D4